MVVMNQRAFSRTKEEKNLLHRLVFIVLLQRKRSQVRKLNYLPRPSLTNIKLSVAVHSLHTGDL